MEIFLLRILLFTHICAQLEENRRGSFRHGNIEKMNPLNTLSWRFLSNVGMSRSSIQEAGASTEDIQTSEHTGHRFHVHGVNQESINVIKKKTASEWNTQRFFIITL